MLLIIGSCFHANCVPLWGLICDVFTPFSSAVTARSCAPGWNVGFNEENLIRK